MAKRTPRASKGDGEQRISASVDDLLLAAQQRGDDSLETGRYIITYKEDARDESAKSLKAQGFLAPIK